MTDADWRAFFTICARVLGSGSRAAPQSQSWCAWTTFESLQSQLTYWTAGLPSASELTESHTTDGGTWGQPFSYQDIAHIIIPKTFYWELQEGQAYEYGTRQQDIHALSVELQAAGLPHRKTDLVLEVKLF